jgi:hypothetical protein
LTVTLMCWAPSMLLFSNYSALGRSCASGVEISSGERRDGRAPQVKAQTGTASNQPKSRVTLACASETYTRRSMQEPAGRSRHGGRELHPGAKNEIAAALLLARVLIQGAGYRGGEQKTTLS